MITRSRNLRINLQVRADHFLRALDELPELAAVIRTINQNFTDYSAAVSTTLHGRPVRGFSLDIGIESNLEERLSWFAKGLTVRDNRTAIARARELGVDLGLYMILFTPEVTLEQIKAELEIYLKEFIDTDVFSKAAMLNLFQELIPYRGTVAYRKLREDGDLIEEGNWTGFRFRDPRVAVFYVLYLYHLHLGQLEQMNTRDELVGKITELLRKSDRLGRQPELQPVIQSIVCELTDTGRIAEVAEPLLAADRE
jgi:hypothetical protein